MLGRPVVQGGLPFSAALPLVTYPRTEVCTYPPTSVQLTIVASVEKRVEPPVDECRCCNQQQARGVELMLPQHDRAHHSRDTVRINNMFLMGVAFHDSRHATLWHLLRLPHGLSSDLDVHVSPSGHRHARRLAGRALEGSTQQQPRNETCYAA